MRESSAWMRAELKRQREQKEARVTILAEQRHRRGYEQHPVGMDEFSVWENEQVWVTNDAGRMGKIHHHGLRLFHSEKAP